MFNPEPVFDGVQPNTASATVKVRDLTVDHATNNQNTRRMYRPQVESTLLSTSFVDSVTASVNRYCAGLSQLVYSTGTMPQFIGNRAYVTGNPVITHSPTGLELVSQSGRLVIYKPINTAAGTSPLDMAFVAIRGTSTNFSTSTLSDFRTDFSLLAEHTSPFQSMVTTVYADVLAFMNSNPTLNVYLCGHSLGGYLATTVGIYLMNTPSVSIRVAGIRTFNSYQFCDYVWQSARGVLATGTFSEDTMPAPSASALPTVEAMTAVEMQGIIHFCMRSDWPSMLLQTLPVDRLVGNVLVYESGATAVTILPDTWSALVSQPGIHTIDAFVDTSVVTLTDDGPVLASTAELISIQEHALTNYPTVTGDAILQLFLDGSNTAEVLSYSSKQIHNNGVGYDWEVTGIEKSVSGAIVDIPSQTIVLPRTITNTGVEFIMRFIRGSATPNRYGVQLRSSTGVWQYVTLSQSLAPTLPALATLSTAFTSDDDDFMWDTGSSVVVPFHEGLRRNLTPVVYNGLQALFPNPASGTAVANIKWHYNANYWYMESSSLNSQVAGNKQVYARSYGNPNPARWGIEWSDNTVLPATDEHQWIITAHNNGSFYTIQNAQYTTQFVGQWGDTAGDMSTVQSANYVQVTLDAFNNASMTLVGTSQSFEAYYRSYTVSSTDQVNYMSWNPMTSSNNSNYSTSGDYTINFEFLA